MKTKQALSGNTSTTISFTKKFSPNETDRKESKNTLYTLIQNDFDADNRNTLKIDKDDLYLSLGNNKDLSNSYNLAGNIDVYCQLPFDNTNVKPNYIQYLLSNSYNDEFLSILLSWLRNGDMLTHYTASTNSGGVNSLSDVITSIDMSKEISNNTYLLKNWNIGRQNWSAENVKKMRNYFAIKFNELIDHIITNDVVTVDNTFKAKWQALFANSNGVLLSYANGTLLAPSLVNYFANQRKINQDALMTCGYVPKGVEFFPFGSDTDFNAFKQKNLRCWWFDNSKFSGIYKESLSENNLYVPLNIGDKLTKLGKFNYPFRSNNWNNEANRGSVETNYNVPYTVVDFPAFTSDKYYWKDTLDNNYAKITYGNSAQDKNIPNKEEKISKTNFEVKFPLNLLYDNLTQGTYCSGCQSRTSSWTKTRCDCNIFKKNKDTRTWQDDYATNCNNSISGWKVNYGKLSSIGDDKFKAWIKAQCDEWKATKNNGKDATDNVIFTSYNRPSSISKSDYGNGYKLTDNYGSADVKYTRAKGNKTLDFRSCCSNESKMEYECSSKGSVKSNYSYWFDKWGAKFDEGKNAYALVSFTATYPRNVTGGWWASYGSLNGTKKVIYTSVNPKVQNTVYDFEKFAKQQRLICLWKTNKPLYVFNNAVFEYWYQILSYDDNVQFALNKLREMIKSKKEMIVLNRMNRIFGGLINYYMKQKKNSIVSLVNLPLGAPLVHIPETFLLDYRFYHASFKFDPIWSGKYNKITKGTSSCNVVNKVDVPTSALKDKNYLDDVFNNLIKKCITTKYVINEDVYFAVLIPNKGQSILDVISPGMGGLVMDDITVVPGQFSNTNKDTSPVYDFSYGKIILTFKPFKSNASGTGDLATLATAYKLIDSVFVPVISLSRISNSQYVEVHVKTKSDPLDENKAVDASTEPSKTPKGLNNNDNSSGTNPTTSNPPSTGDNNNNNNNSGTETFKAKAKFITSNRMYIYVSAANYQDFTSSVRGKGSVESDKNVDKNQIVSPLLTIAYQGLDAMFPSNCLRIIQL